MVYCLEDRCDKLTNDNAETDSMFATNESIVKYRVVGFSQLEGVDHDVTLALGFCRDEGFDLVQVV